MAKRYVLCVMLRGEAEALLFDVRRQDWDRLRQSLVQKVHDEPKGFFWFDSLDGRSVLINLRYVQAVRFLWDPTPAPPDTLRSDEGMLIKFRDRLETLATDAAAPIDLFDFFRNLEFGDLVFPAFEDEDGELLLVSASEIVWLSAPAHLLDEGRRDVEAEESDASDRDSA